MFTTPDGVFRALSPAGTDDWQALVESRLWRELQDEGHVVATEPADIGAVPDQLAGQAAGVLHDERTPFVSDPYKWPFSMLKNAALLQLEVNQRALRTDLALKVATPYNLQWRGTRPMFIDIGSFERLRPGEPWQATDSSARCVCIR